jgi:hypothetical protein
MSIDTPPPVAKPKPNKKWLLFGITGILVILLLTNPNQTAHFTAIQEARKVRLSAVMIESSTALGLILEYHNYGIFSTVTGTSGTWSFGCLGRVETTDEIKRPF